MRIGFTGTQRGMTKEQREWLELLLDAYHPVEIHHGDCIGADEELDTMVRSLWPSGPARLHVHPPLNPSKRAWTSGRKLPPMKVYGQKDYLDRNRDIVDAADFVIACPSTKHEVQRSGTWATIRYARDQEKRVFVLAPDGSVVIYYAGQQGEDEK